MTGQTDSSGYLKVALGSGSAIDGATVGATTPSTGAFTTLTASTSMTAPIEGHSVDVVQVANTGISTSDTNAFVFDFVPSKIVLHYSGRCVHDTTSQPGHTTGNAVIIITGTDTFTSNLNWESVVLYNLTFDVGSGINNTTNVVYIQGGYDGTDYATVVATGAWVTATKTLTITYTAANTNGGGESIGMIATAYR